MDMHEFNAARASVKPLIDKAEKSGHPDDIAQMHISLALHGLLAILVTQDNKVTEPICTFMMLPLIGEDGNKKSLFYYVFPADQLPM